MRPPYMLWSGGKSWCEYEITTDPDHLPAIRSLFEDQWFEGSQTLESPVDLVPEPYCPRGEWAISVRARGRTLGYLNAEDSPAWAPVVRRVVASGFVPRTTSQIWGHNYESFERVDNFGATVRISLGEPRNALPLNQPPEVPYTMLPRSSIVQVTKEDQHTNALLKFVPPGGHGVLFVTLHEHVPMESHAKAHVEVRIDDERIGQLTPQMSQRFLPMIRHIRDRGLITACWGDITGSAVAAEVRVDGVKANEVTNDVLTGDPIEVPRLVPELPDPRLYDLSADVQLIRPVLPMRSTARSLPAEPADGTVVRFDRANGRYTFVAVRRGAVWETTATDDWGTINEVMSWGELAPRARKFEKVTAWADIGPHGDPLVRQRLAVVRFTIQHQYLAAVNIANDGGYEGNWYTTITDAAEQRLPFGDRASWSEIARYGQYLQVATAWEPL